MCSCLYSPLLISKLPTHTQTSNNKCIIIYRHTVTPSLIIFSLNSQQRNQLKLGSMLLNGKFVYVMMFWFCFAFCLFACLLAY